MAPQPGLGARVDIDTRFISTPTALKAVVMALGVLSVLISIAMLAVLDRGATHRIRHVWRRFWRVGWATWGAADAAVLAAVGVARDRRHLLR